MLIKTVIINFKQLNRLLISQNRLILSNLNKTYTRQIRFNSNNAQKPQEPQRLERPASGGQKSSFIHITWKSVVVVMLFGGALLLLKFKAEKDKEESLKRQRKQAVGKMAIGGPFELVDCKTGKLVKSEDYRGKWLLVYFGFTHCPDVCPEEIEKLIKTISLVEKVTQEQEVLPVFITVDPDRDDAKAVAKYVQEFSPKLIGLTGSKEQVEQVTRAYRVYFSQGPKDEDKDYIVDHTVITYLINPDGQFTDYYGQNKTAEDIASAAVIHMGTWKLTAGKH